MYNLADFVEYDGEIARGEHPVLVWSRATGYYFTQFGFVFGDLKIIARLK